MIHRISILFGLLLCLSAAVAQDFGRSQRVLDWLQQQKGDSVYALCNAEMKAALTAQQLGGIYAQLVRQAGTENGRGEWERTVVEGGIEVDGIRLDFAQTSLMALLSWNGEGQLCGLFFRPTTPPQTVAVGGVENREVQIENGKIFLPGTLTLPTERKKPVALAVLLAGSGPCDRNETIGPNALLRDLADSLALHGIASIRYDKRTLVYGSACIEISGGMDYDKEIVDDALAALQQACALPEVDARRIFVVGHSLSGMLLPRIAQRATTPLAGMIALAAPARPLAEVMKEQLNYLGRLNNIKPTEIDSTYRASLAPLPKEYLKFDRKYRPLRTAQQLAMPMLFLQGGHDYQVRQTDFQLWQQALGKSPNVDFRWMPTLNHLMAESPNMSRPDDYAARQIIATPVVETIVDFIGRH